MYGGWSFSLKLRRPGFRFPLGHENQLCCSEHKVGKKVIYAALCSLEEMWDISVINIMNIKTYRPIEAPLKRPVKALQPMQLLTSTNSLAFVFFSNCKGGFI